jgi:hypothetical protein
MPVAILFRLSTYRLKNKYIFVRFEVFAALTMKNAVFWDVMPCGSCKNRRFRGTYRLRHQGDNDRRARNNFTAEVSSSPIPVTLMMEAMCSSETSILTKATCQKTTFFKCIYLQDGQRRWNSDCIRDRRLWVRISSPGRDQNFLLLTSSRPTLGPAGYRRPQCEAHHSPPTSAHPLLHMPPWRFAKLLKHSDKFTFFLFVIG